MKLATTIKAGLLYFLVVFVVGFVTGTVRVTMLVPNVGEGTAVAIEIPVMLLVSWLMSIWAVEHFEVPDRADSRLTMGILAFVLLQLAELGMSLALGMTVAGHLALYTNGTVQAGLLAQVAFALFPWMQRQGK